MKVRPGLLSVDEDFLLLRLGVWGQYVLVLCLMPHAAENDLLITPRPLCQLQRQHCSSLDSQLHLLYASWL